jgi:hypothetical protein
MANRISVVPGVSDTIRSGLKGIATDVPSSSVTVTGNDPAPESGDADRLGTLGWMVGPVAVGAAAQLVSVTSADTSVVATANRALRRDS